MSTPEACSYASLAALEPLAGTATEAADWLLVEVRGAWGRDPVADTELPSGVRERLTAAQGRVTFVRRRDRRAGAVVVHAVVDEAGESLRYAELAALEDAAQLDHDAAEPTEGPFVLVCGHGRRDACCARLGPPILDALAPHFEANRLWQSSHLGGHRFAPNVVILPTGVQLGRVPPERAPEVAAHVHRGTIPLDLYRGRVIYPVHVQAAEIVVRAETGCDRVDEVRLLAVEDGHVTFSTPAGDVSAVVERRDGPVIPVSCGAEPEPTAVWVAGIV